MLSPSGLKEGCRKASFGGCVAAISKNDQTSKEPPALPKWASGFLLSQHGSTSAKYLRHHVCRFGSELENDVSGIAKTLPVPNKRSCDSSLDKQGGFIGISIFLHFTWGPPCDFLQFDNGHSVLTS